MKTILSSFQSIYLYITCYIGNMVVSVIVRIAALSLLVSLAIATSVKEEPVRIDSPVFPDIPTIDPQFETSVSSLKAYVNVPAITHITTMQEDEFAEGGEIRIQIEQTTDLESVFRSLVDRIPVDSVPFLDILAELVETHTDRVLAQFPRLVYSDDLDGTLLRNISANIQSIADTSGSNIRHVSRVVRRITWMRKWAWTIVVLMEHITRRSGLTFRESELLLVSIAPTMHAFLHALFMLEIDFPDFFLGFQNVISSVTKYHPIYTRDDTVWYIRLTPEFRNEIYTSEPIPVFPLDVPDVEFFESQWGEEFLAEILTTPRSLVQHIHRLLNSLILTRPFRPSRFEASALMEPLALTMHTLRYLKEFSPDYYRELVLAGLLDSKPNRAQTPLTRAMQIATLLHDHVTIRGIMEHFSNLILNDKVMLTNIVAIDNMANRLVSISSQEIGTRLVYSTDVKETLHAISNCTRFELAGPIHLGFVPIQDLFEVLLDNVFLHANGIFTFSHNHYQLTESALTRSSLVLGIGRLFGLIVKSGNPLNMLGRYITIASPSSTVFETFFFSSETLRRGFHDVILENSIESIYQYGSQIVTALDILSREFFVL